ncbi:MAG: NifB/NifX family molybdenum-iron cluster-binding protein [Oligoflexia bacterium]|nr:NifB/NifX family molybdenum-iron cluster-binding protein [Oligoflexia bacterium]MBF0367542.1 NifB/NifX family molybdenum-iron cluster-binding protein [Oligoflexia bacterium]
MIVAIPTSNGKLCMHFGHCDVFSLIEINDSKQIISKKEVVPPPHEPGILPPWLASQGVELILAGGMGVRAQQLFQEKGVKVLTGVVGELPEDLVRAYLDGKLVTGENACDH